MASRKEFWRLAWPAAAEGLLLMLLTAADLLMVTSLGNTAVAAVSIFSQPRMVILCVTRSYSVALSAYVARRRGEDPDESLTACSRASLMLGCGLSILLLVGTWIGAGPLLQLAGAQDDYISLALRYAFPALVSLAFSGPAIVLHGILAGLGDTKSVLVSNVLGNGVNVVFNALLIYGLGPVPQLGVFGAGLAWNRYRCWRYAGLYAGAFLTAAASGHSAGQRGLAAGTGIPPLPGSPCRGHVPGAGGGTVRDVHILPPGGGSGHSGAKRPQHLREPVRHLL